MNLSAGGLYPGNKSNGSRLMIASNDSTGIDEITKASAYRIAPKASGVPITKVESRVASKAKGIPKTELEWIKRLQKKRAEAKDKSPEQTHQLNRQSTGNGASDSVPTFTMEDDESTARWNRFDLSSSKTNTFVQKRENPAPRPTGTAPPNRESRSQLLARLNQPRGLMAGASRTEDSPPCSVTRANGSNTANRSNTVDASDATSASRAAKRSAQPIAQMIKTWP
jgi:hypothetical protein